MRWYIYHLGCEPLFFWLGRAPIIHLLPPLLPFTTSPSPVRWWGLITHLREGERSVTHLVLFVFRAQKGNGIWWVSLPFFIWFFCLRLRVQEEVLLRETEIIVSLARYTTCCMTCMRCMIEYYSQKGMIWHLQWLMSIEDLFILQCQTGMSPFLGYTMSVIHFDRPDFVIWQRLCGCFQHLT